MSRGFGGEGVHSLGGKELDSSFHGQVSSPRQDLGHLPPKDLGEGDNY